eukprot:NODE_3679_length_936_cov_23.866967_g3380_i0.p1 GENE.NODE_3679_length_936_cov_23.866967_g3380_i0~~NODE_3679_length_936_cov_23.866967_g3380_i0.p1  ORF type:complete len:235 (-),score=57.39 NODE_3679_length_936_cov_23.866967_g3380_i0:162-866(-)
MSEDAMAMNPQESFPEDDDAPVAAMATDETPIEDDAEDDGMETREPNSKSKTSVEEIMNMDSEDESLRKYKEALLGAAAAAASCDPSDDPRMFVIESFLIEVDGKYPLSFSLSTPEALEALKKKPFILKEGITLRYRIRFRVQHGILIGIRWKHIVSKAGMKVWLQDESIGSFGPGSHEWVSSPVDVPSGKIFKSFQGQQRFTDDDNTTLLKFNYCFELRKQWPLDDVVADRNI